MKIRRALLLFGGGIKRLLNLANLFSFEADHTTPTAGVLPVYKPYGGLGDFTVVRGSSATYVDSVGIIKESLDNIARIDYTNGVAELLTEPQSTNLIPYSEDFSDASWVKTPGGTGLSSIVTPNYSISPDGSQNASRLQLDLGGGTTGSDRSRIRAALSSGTESETTSSIYIKSNTVNQIITIRSIGVLSQPLVSNDWIRIDVSEATTSRFIEVGIYGDTSINNTADMSIFGAQIEELPYATSYIPTNGSTVTRLQDSITDGGNVNVINSEEGVLFFEGSALVDGGENRYMSIDDGTANNRINFNYSATPNRIIISNVIGGATQVIFSYTSFNQTNNNKVAFKWGNNNYALWVNGVEVEADLTKPSWAANVLNTANFTLWDKFSSPFFGRTGEFLVYNRALTDEELQSITTL